MPKNIVFFDGICPLCNALLRFLLKIDKREQLCFSPLQGETFKKLYPEEPEDVKTIVFHQNQRKFHRSEAIIRIFTTTTPRLKFLLLFLWIPKIIRDSIYKIISSSRYQIFGKYKQCMIPDEKLKHRFLP